MGSRPRWLASIVGTGLWLACWAPPAEAYCRLRAEEQGTAAASDECVTSGMPLAWRHRCLSYSVASRSRNKPNFERVRDAIAWGFEAWRTIRCDGDPIGLDLVQTQQVSECEEPQHNPRQANIHSVMFVQDWRKRGLPRGVFGLTLVWHDPKTGEIFDSDMQINETLGDLAVCGNECEPGQVDIQNVVTHEAGHFLGLGHSEDADASMFSDARTGETTKRSLEKDDMAGACSIYGDRPPPECTLGDFAPRNGLTLRCVDPEPNGGCSVGGALGRRAAAAWPAALLAVVGLCALRRRHRRPSRA